MLYLAQIHSDSNSAQIGLQLLAQQRQDQSWCINETTIILCDRDYPYAPGVLVLVELGTKGEILTLQEARDWLLELLKKYPAIEAITPEFVQQEQLRIEQWRQEITAQSLELTRRSLEIETRRDQLQELEESLKQEREQLELRSAQLSQIYPELSSSESDDNHQKI
jgi:hypothetical protein